MLLPKRVKYRRQHRPKTTGRSKGGNYVTFGEFGLQATTTSWITSRQIESARIAMTRYMKRGGKVWIKIFPHTPYTKKPLEVRMGAGKVRLKAGSQLLNQVEFYSKLLAFLKKLRVKHYV